MEPNESIIDFTNIDKILLKLTNFPEKICAELDSILESGTHGYASNIRVGGNVVCMTTHREYKPLREMIKSSLEKREMKLAPSEDYEEVYSSTKRKRESFIILRPHHSNPEVATIEMYLRKRIYICWTIVDR